MNEMKSGKAPGLNGFPVECLKKCGMAVRMASGHDAYIYIQ